MMTSSSSDFKLCDFTVAVDTREQHPWSFLGFKCDSPHAGRDLIIPTCQKALKTGDYSIIGMEDEIAIERKSLQDLYSTLGQSRDRFIRELERMKEMEFAALVIEADWTVVCNCPPEHSKLHPKTVFRSLIAFAQRYKVHVYPCKTRHLAERVAFRILQRYWIDSQPGGHYDKQRTTTKMEGIQSSDS